MSKKNKKNKSKQSKPTTAAPVVPPVVPPVAAPVVSTVAPVDPPVEPPQGYAPRVASPLQPAPLKRNAFGFVQYPTGIGGDRK